MQMPTPSGCCLLLLAYGAWLAAVVLCKYVQNNADHKQLNCLTPGFLRACCNHSRGIADAVRAKVLHCQPWIWQGV